MSIKQNNEIVYSTYARCVTYRCRVVRDAAYNTLSTWIRVSGNMCGGFSVTNWSNFNDLLVEIFSDIECKSDDIGDVCQ